MRGQETGWVTSSEEEEEEAYLILSLCLLLHHPRRPRGSQSGREKRRDESFTVQTGMLLLIASEMFSRVIGSSFVSC